MIACLGHNVQIFCSQTGEDFDENVYDAEIDADLSRKPYATSGLRQAITHNYIEKPFWLTGDTLHERKVIKHALRGDVMDFYSRYYYMILYRDRIEVAENYCYLPFLNNRQGLSHHVSSKNYLQLPDDLEVPDRILTKTEYQTILAAAHEFTRINPNQEYRKVNDHELRSYCHRNFIFHR